MNLPDAPAMDAVRRLLAVVAIATYGPALLLWPIVHPLIRVWRRLGPVLTYLIVAPALACVALSVLYFRTTLIGLDLGTHWALIACGVAIDAGLLLWGVLIGRRMNHLDLRQRMGVPELSGDDRSSALVRDGLYGYVRHPLYVSAAIAGVGYAVVVNYVGVYVLEAAALAMIALVIAIEERELVNRFGQVYRDYQRDVPCAMPRLRKATDRHERIS